MGWSLIFCWNESPNKLGVSSLKSFIYYLKSYLLIGGFEVMLDWYMSWSISKGSSLRILVWGVSGNGCLLLMLCLLEDFWLLAVTEEICQHLLSELASTGSQICSSYSGPPPLLLICVALALFCFVAQMSGKSSSYFWVLFSAICKACPLERLCSPFDTKGGRIRDTAPPCWQLYPKSSASHCVDWIVFACAVLYLNWNDLVEHF